MNEVAKLAPKSIWKVERVSANNKNKFQVYAHDALVNMTSYGYQDLISTYINNNNNNNNNNVFNL